MESAHDSFIWNLSWHPLGHVLVSCSSDHTSKFWCRNRPGEEMRDRYNTASALITEEAVEGEMSMNKLVAMETVMVVIIHVHCLCIYIIIMCSLVSLMMSCIIECGRSFSVYGYDLF